MSKCKAESVVGYRLREFPGQTPLLLFTSLTFRVGGCGTCKDVQYPSSCRPKRRGEIGAEGSITHSCSLIPTSRSQHFTKSRQPKQACVEGLFNQEVGIVYTSVSSSYYSSASSSALKDACLAVHDTFR